jgi:shikimate dehydrogenase
MEFYGLLGETLGHSLSPRIHHMAFAKLGILGAYKLLPVAPKNLGQAVEAVKLLGIRGLNVTIPYKQSIMAYLDDLSPEARRIGAVNTLSLTPRGLIGYNTDYAGFAQLLQYYGIEIKGKTAALLGTGGVAQAIAAVLLDGAIETLYWVTRNKTAFNQKRSQDLRVQISHDQISHVQIISYQELLHCQGDIMINATPVGMAPQNQTSPVGRECIANFDSIVDTIYNPLETSFLAIGRSLGKQVCGGLYMLVAQAMQAQELWQGQAIPDAITKEIYDVLLKKQGMPRKLCLIGMPGSGKTTLGRQLARKLGRPFIDLDQYIEQIAGESVAEIFAQGEAAFRSWETEACRRLASEPEAVIACGGGVVLNPLNLEWLRKDAGEMIFIDRPLADIAADIRAENRPLLKDNPDMLEQLYNQRYDLYCRATLWQVSNEGSLAEALSQLLAIVNDMKQEAKP